MDQQTPPHAAETQKLGDAYAALNRNDIPAFVQIFDPHIERIEPADSPGGGIYHGLEAVQAHVSFHRGNWAEGSCEPRRFIVADDRIIVLTDVRVRLKHETEWREGSTADAFTFRDGKVIHWRTFFDVQQALEWAGVDAAGINAADAD